MSKKRNHLIHLTVPVLFYEADGVVVAHCPAFDIATEGKNEKQAKKMFKEMFEIFIEDICSRNVLQEVLKECGWRRVEGNALIPFYKPPKFDKKENGYKIRNSS